MRSRDSMGPVSDLHHVSLLVSDIPRAMASYGDVLRLERDNNRPDLGYPSAWFWVGNRQIHLKELPNPDPTAGRPLQGLRCFAAIPMETRWSSLPKCAAEAPQKRLSGGELIFCATR
jgi:hypothetical protein